MDTADFAKNLCFNASALYRVVNKVAAFEMSFTGLTPSYAFLIMVVEHNPGIRINQLSLKLYLDASTVTRLIEKLEEKKFVLRDSSPGITQVYLTELGHRAYENVSIGVTLYLEQFKSSLGKKAFKELNNCLIEAVDTLRKVRPED